MTTQKKSALADVLWEVIKKLGSGQHSLPETERLIALECDRRGIPATHDDIKRELRDMAGYP